MSRTFCHLCRRHNKTCLRRQLTRWRHDERLNVLELLIDALKNADRERGRLACTRLRLRDHIFARTAGHNRALLNSRRLLETERVNAAHEIGLNAAAHI